MKLTIALFASMAATVSAECPNACSGHGSCSSFDMCTCSRNWQGSDCSQRTCPFGLAHVDTPKGDLDHSNSITTGTVISSSTVYPYGTQEQFPDMSATLSGGSTTLTNTAHYYMECANKGICDRKTGECECFDGYDGAACQRASCPNSCSGHGTCETISELAAAEFGNVYNLWDADLTMGCACDAGYGGADCSSRMCKYGIDPLYTDDTSARVTSTNVRIETNHDGVGVTGAGTLEGTYALKFYDVFGEDYVTQPILASATGADQCSLAKAALEALPNSVVSSVTCTDASNKEKTAATVTNTNAKALNTNGGFDMELTFTSNPGVLKQIEIDTNLDGGKPTLYAKFDGTENNDDAAYVTANTYQSGTTGEFVDYFATKCSGVEATVTTSVDPSNPTTWDADAKVGSLAYLGGLTAAEQNLLKACLGDSDGDATNNQEVYDWDYGYDLGAGSFLMGPFPHAIKTVPVTRATTTTEGEFHLVWYDPSTTNKFRVTNLPTVARAVASNIFTTSGVVERLGMNVDSEKHNNVKTRGDGDRYDQNKTLTGYWDGAYTNKVYTSFDASCESGDTTTAGGSPESLFNCVQKGDKLFIVDGCWGNALPAGVGKPMGGMDETATCANSASANLGTGNLYTVTKIYTQAATATSETYNSGAGRFTAGDYENRYIIEVDYNIGWTTALGDADGSGTSTSGIVILFKFTPSTTTGNYEYVSQCGNRGSCDGETGLCACFKGYTGDDCTTMSSLAI